MCMFCVCIGIALNGDLGTKRAYAMLTYEHMYGFSLVYLWFIYGLSMAYLTCYFICVYVFAVYRSSTLFFPQCNGHVSTAAQDQMAACIDSV